jgi:hypothetical protein
MQHVVSETASRPQAHSAAVRDGGFALHFPRERVRMPHGLIGRLLDIIGPRLVPEDGDRPDAAPSLGWIAATAVMVTSALLLLAIAQHIGYRGQPNSALHWSGYGLLFLPVAFRVFRPATARTEQIVLVIMGGMATLAAKWLFSATRFVFFDEFLHVITATDIIERKQLYTTNPLLPISPMYPGMELVATSIAELTGLPLFVAGWIMLAASRALLVVGLYCLYERVTGSSRVAAVACLVYMANSGFVLFDGQFAYESLALTLFVFALLAASLCRDASSRLVAAFGLTLPLLAAIAMTHHMSAYFTAGFLSLLAALALLNRVYTPGRWMLLVIALAAILFPVAWSRLQGDPGKDYLGPILQKGSTELANLVSGAGRSRQLFSTDGGEQSSIYVRVLSIVSLLLTVAGLCTGFFRALAQGSHKEGGWAAFFQVMRLRWSDNWMVLIALAAVGFPISVGFRLTSAGWEIGSRMGPFVFLGVGLVIAIALVRFWQPAGTGRWRSLGVAVALTLCFVGGIATGWGNPSNRTMYRVIADAASVEPMGIDAAQWTRNWLGPHNRFAADRINRVLLATYGRQTIVTTLFDDVDTSFVFHAPRLTRGELAALTRGHVEYLMVDMRMTTALPRFGYYFEKGEYQERPGEPIAAESLLKFNGSPGFDRLFDNGSQIVFGTTGLPNVH